MPILIMSGAPSTICDPHPLNCIQYQLCKYINVRLVLRIQHAWFTGRADEGCIEQEARRVRGCAIRELFLSNKVKMKDSCRLDNLFPQSLIDDKVWNSLQQLHRIMSEKCTLRHWGLAWGMWVLDHHSLIVRVSEGQENNIDRLETYLTALPTPW